VNQLKEAWARWYAFARKVGNFVGGIAMTVFYFTVMLPFGLGVRFFGDPLGLKTEKPHWSTVDSHEQTIDSARRLY
jgi:hypothetical protein